MRGVHFQMVEQGGEVVRERAHAGTVGGVV